MSKVNVAITLDSHVANWLNEQPQKRSTLINSILLRHIVNNSESKRPSRTELLEKRRQSFQNHWEALQEELGL
jgi:hypothetical protein